MAFIPILISLLSHTGFRESKDSTSPTNQYISIDLRIYGCVHGSEAFLAIFSK